MIWFNLLGTTLLGTGKGLSSLVTTSILSYNGYSFDNENIRIKSIGNIDNLDNYTFNTYKTARQDGQGFISWNLDSKSITVTGTLTSGSPSGLQKVIEWFKQALLVPNQELTHRKNDGTQVNTTATVTALTIPRQHYHINFTPYQVTFQTLEPFFYGVNRVINSYLWKSSSFTDKVVSTLGNYKAKPRIIVQLLEWCTDVTTITVGINGNYISATAAANFVDSDIIEFDAEIKDVELNSIGNQLYTGAFWFVNIGTNDIDIAIDGIRAADIYIQRQPTYV